MTRVPDQFNEGRTAFLNNSAGVGGYTPCKRKELNFYLKPYTKINSKQIVELNERAKTTKLLGENKD